jgi:uncharacterized protein (TIGR00255 family)
MTGFGSATLRRDNISVSVEIKAVNNRYLKISLRTADGYASLEPEIENLLRETLRRGTITAHVRIIRQSDTSEYAIDESVLSQYVVQLRELNAKLGIETQIVPSQLLTLPGVVKEAIEPEDKTGTVVPVLEEAVILAINELQTMRRKEGDSMMVDLRENIHQLVESIAQIEQFVPRVAEQYRAKLMERVGRVMTEQNLTLDPADLIREVALFADRSDISEEIVRFRSHLTQFDSVIAETNPKDGCGRRLDFLTQEMFREVNTIGAKANDSDITKIVVELKAVIERIREMVQNIE